jgi:hypothetical protein
LKKKTQSTIVTILGEKPSEHERKLEPWLESRLFNGGPEFRISEEQGALSINIPGITSIRISIPPSSVSSEDENVGFLNDLIQRNENALKFYEWIKLQTKNRTPVPQNAVKVFLRNPNQITICRTQNHLMF